MTELYSGQINSKLVVGLNSDNVLYYIDAKGNLHHDILNCLYGMKKSTPEEVLEFIWQKI